MSDPASAWRWARAYDVALGASAVSWAVLGLWRAEERPWSVRIALAAVNLLVGGLFLIRREPLSSGGARAIAAALPSMVLGAAAVKLADGAWPIAAQVVFALGAAGACASLATLGRSFAFLPSRRALVVGGPYRLVRHPAYLAELFMMLACALVRPWPGVALAAGGALTLAWRIAAEERVLAEDEAYVEYRARVRWRLVPGLY